jgi:uncharacterized membrane protein YccF (DUF307 family)
MFKKERALVTIVFLGTMIATLAVAFLMVLNPTKKLVLLILIVVEFCSYVWYSLSFIPFGRRIAKKTCKKCVKDNA